MPNLTFTIILLLGAVGLTSAQDYELKKANEIIDSLTVENQKLSVLTENYKELVQSNTDTIVYLKTQLELQAIKTQKLTEQAKEELRRSEWEQSNKTAASGEISSRSSGNYMTIDKDSTEQLHIKIERLSVQMDSLRLLIMDLESENDD